MLRAVRAARACCVARRFLTGQIEVGNAEQQQLFAVTKAWESLGGSGATACSGPRSSTAMGFVTGSPGASGQSGSAAKGRAPLAQSRIACAVPSGEPLSTTTIRRPG